MSNIIIYPNDQGGIAVLIPVFDCGLSLNDIAKKDVPIGKPYKILNTTTLPPESVYWDEFFDALEHDFTNDFDGIGGE